MDGEEVGSCSTSPNEADPDPGEKNNDVHEERDKQNTRAQKALSVPDFTIKVYAELNG